MVEGAEFEVCVREGVAGLLEWVWRVIGVLGEVPRHVLNIPQSFYSQPLAFDHSAQLGNTHTHKMNEVT